MTMITTVALALVFTMSAGQKTQPAQVSVYVFTQSDPSGFVDAAQKQRLDSVKDLIKSLDDKKSLVVVDSPEAATIVIEVLDRSVEANGDTTTKSTSGYDGTIRSETTPNKFASLRLALKIGDYKTEIFHQNDQFYFAEWREAAKLAAAKVERWVKANRAQLERQAR